MQTKVELFNAPVYTSIATLALLL